MNFISGLYGEAIALVEDNPAVAFWVIVGLAVVALVF